MPFSLDGVRVLERARSGRFPRQWERERSLGLDA
jgi:hypothetical protein